MLQVRLLGELRVEPGGGPAGLPRSRPALALLAWLALHPGLHPRASLAARFWPDVLDASARANLRNALWVLRTALGEEAGAHLRATRDGAGIRPEGLWTDVAEFRRLLAAGQAEAALDLCTGELLADLDEDWVLDAREEHRREVAGALARLAGESEEAGRLPEAVAWSRRAAALEPRSEEAARALMRLLAAAGDRAGALAAYARLADRLRQELGMATSPETRALAARIRAGPMADAAAERPRPTPAPDPVPLVGRGPELASLEAAWERCRRGEGRAVVLSGEAGIGKTRLAAELAARARREGVVAVGAGLDLAGAAPFALWTELVRELLAAAGPVPPEAPWAPELARLAPGLEARTGRAPAPVASPELERARLFEAVAASVEWAAGRRPCLLVMEDVHAADPASLALAGYVGRRAAALPLLLLLTRREAPARPEVDALLDRLRAAGVPSDEIALGPLPAGDVARLARAAGVRAEADVERVVTAADGNPLLARALGAGAPGASSTLRAAARAAALGLDEDARALAELAAVAGRDLESHEVARLPLADAALAAAGGVESGLLSADQGRVGYRHALLREVVAADLAGPALARRHAELAEAIALGGAPRRAGEIAQHLRHAGRHEEARRHLVGAAADARAVGALAEAAGFLGQALEIRDDEGATWLALVEVEAWRGRPDEVRRAFERATALVPASDPARLAGAHLRVARLWRGALCDPETCRVHYRAALTLLEDGGGDAIPARAEAMAGIAWCEAVVGSADEAEELLRALHGLMGRARPSDLLAHDVNDARAHVLIRRGRFAESTPPLIAAAASARAAGRLDMVYGTLAWAASAAATAGDLERALELVDRSLAAMRESGLRQPEGILESARAGILARLGRHADARESAASARALAERIDDPGLAALAAHDAGMVELAAGEYAAAADLLEEALARDAPVSRPLARLARAEALSLLGRADEAEAELRRTALEPVSPSDFPDTLVARLARVQGLVARARGDLPLAARRLEEALHGWRRRLDPVRVGDAYASALLDLGRVPVAGLVEPAREVARLEAELAELGVGAVP